MGGRRPEGSGLPRPFDECVAAGVVGGDGERGAGELSRSRDGEEEGCVCDKAELWKKGINVDPEAISANGKDGGQV